MLRRLWTKDKPSIVVTLGSSWTYAITALSMKPDYAHELWFLSFMLMLPTWLCVVDAMAVHFQLRMHQKMFKRMVGTENKMGKKHNVLGSPRIPILPPDVE